MNRLEIEKYRRGEEEEWGRSVREVIHVGRSVKKVKSNSAGKK